MGGDDLAPAGGVADTLRRSLASMGDDLAPAGGANGRYADEPGGGGGGAPASEETDGFSLDLDLALARAEDAGAGRPASAWKIRRAEGGRDGGVSGLGER